MPDHGESTSWWKNGRHLLPLAGLVAAWLVCLAPLLRRANTHIVSRTGGVHADAGLHVWQHWWVRHALEEGLPVFQTTMLTFPSELDLTKVWGGHLDLALGLPLSYPLGPLCAANLVLALMLLSCGIGVYLLAHAVSGDRLASALGGILYMTSPVVLHEAADGRVEQLSFGLVALSLWGLGRWFARGRGVDLVVAVSMLGLATLGYLGAAMAAAMLIPVLVLGFLPAMHRGGALPERRILLRRGGLAVAALAVVAIPVLAYASSHIDTPWFLWSMDDGPAREEYLSWLEGSSTASKTLSLPTFGENPLGSLGLALVLLAPLSLLSLLRRASSRPILPWWLGAVALAILAMGPNLSWLGGGHVASPYRWLPQFIPFVLRFHWPYRFALLGGICMAVLAAVGLARLGTLRGLRGLPMRVLVAAGVLVLTICQTPDALPLPVVRALPPPAIYQTLAQTGQGALFDVDIGELDSYDPYLAQTVHGRPICCLGLPDSLQPGSLTALRQRDEGFAYLSTPRMETWRGTASSDPVPGSLSSESLANLGFTHLVVHLPRQERRQRDLCRSRILDALEEPAGTRPALDTRRAPGRGPGRPPPTRSCTPPLWVVTAFEHRWGPPIETYVSPGGSIELYSIAAAN